MGQADYNGRVEKGKHFYCHEIGAYEAKALIVKYHYSHKTVSNSKLHFGIFDNNTGKLCGALQYGYPMNPKSTPQKIVKKAIYTEMLELNRMAMADDSPKLSESEAIGLTIRYIKKQFPEVKWLLSFSDGKQGNVGTIYQATNWDYVGFNKSDSFFELDGSVFHSVQIWHKFREGKPNVKTMDELYRNFQNVSKIESRQYVYVFPIAKGLEYVRQKTVYPKRESEPRITKRTIYKKNGVVLEKPVVIGKQEKECGA